MAEVILKGASKGGGSSFQQTPDNLRSNDTFEGVLGIGIGPMRGPTRGLKSIKINGTAVENETGDLNFENFIVNVGDGDPAKFPQIVQLKLGQGAAPLQIGLSITNSNTSGPGDWITQTINNTNADFLDLRFIVSELYKQTKDGIYSDTLSLDIEMKPVGSTTWINPALNVPTGSYNEQGQYVEGTGQVYVPRKYYDSNGNWIAQSSNYKITGKTTSPAVYELRIAVPNTGDYADTGWDVRVRLVEKDDIENDPNFEKRTVSWESMAAVYAQTMGNAEGWRGVTWMQIYGKASDQLTGVPTVTGEWDSKIVSVPPSNIFDPENRTYTTAIWDGSWSKAWTNDPAWVINDAISDSLSGLSLIAPGSYLNKWDALEASKWCSQLVSDGDTGTEPRYSLNIAISDAQKAEDFIRYLAGAVGGLAWDQGDGEWRLKMDKPENPVDIFTLDNIEGEFTYSHTDVDTRYNDITGSFNNAEMDYREDRVRIFDNTSIAAIGRKPTTIALVGCTGRQEALRRLKLRIRSTVNETRMVSFVTNRRGRNIDQLDTILIADGDLGDLDTRTTGRTVDISTDRKTITLRDTMRLETGVDYTLRFSSPNDEYDPEATAQPDNDEWRKPTLVYSRAVTNTSAQRGDVRVIYLDEALPADIPLNLAVALEATDLPTLPVMYRVMNLTVDDDGERIAISALQVDTGKWDAADNVSKEDTVFQDLTGVVPVPEPPESGQLLSLVRVPANQGSNVDLVATWIRPSSAFVSGFRVRYSINGGAWKIGVDKTQEPTFELVNPVPGNYQFEICTIDRRGGYSEPLLGNMLVTQDLINAAQIYYVDDTGTPLLPINDLKPAEPGSDVTGNNTANDTNNVAGVPAQDIVDGIANALPVDTVAPSAPTLPATPLTFSSSIDPVSGQPVIKMTFTWNANSEPDLAGYDIEFKEASGSFIGGYSATKSQHSITITVKANTAYSAHVRAFDTQGNVGGFSATAGPTTSTKDNVAPAAPVMATPLAAVGGAFLKWTNPSDLDVDKIKVYQNTTNNSGTATLIATVNAAPSTAGGYAVTGVTTGGLRYYWTKATDTSGNDSGFSNGVSVTIPQAVAADIADGSLVASKLADATITAQKIAAGLSFVENFTGSLPTTGNYEGRTGTLSGKLYRYTGGAWTASVAASDISGALQDAQVASLAASKITGQLTDSQIAQLAASKVSGQLTDSQLAAISAAKVTGQLVDSQLAAVSAAKVTGTLTDAQLSAISAAKVTGQITSTQITNNAITTAKLAAGAVTAAQIAANTITAAQVAAGTLTATELASKSITVDKLVVTATGSTNADPYFEDATAWPQNLNSGTKTITDGLRGPNVVYTQNQYSAVVAPTSTLRAIDPTKNYTIQCTMRRLSGTGVFYGIVRFYDANLQPISSTGNNFGWPSNGANFYWPSGYQPPDTNWQTLTTQFGPDYTMKVPANAAYVLVGFLLNYNIAETCETQVNEYRIRPMVAAELIVNGTITAAQIAADTITAAQIAAGAVTTNEIAASTITGANIHAATITGSHLVANTITAGQIAAQTITATQIASGTITASQIAAGSITGDRLVANTITASQIAVGTIGPDLLYNGYGQTGNIDGWAALQTTGNPTTLAVSTGSYDRGTTHLLMTKGAVSDGAGWAPKPIPVIPGKQYNVRIAFNGSAGTASGLYLRMFSGTSSVNNYSGNMTELVPGSSAIPGSRTIYNVTWTCPSTDGWAQPTVYNWTGGPLQMAFSVEMTEMIAGVLIQSGAVTADKIAANSITAGQIASGTITGDLIAANTITANKLVIASNNLIANSDFSTGDLTAWRPWNAVANVSVISSSGFATAFKPPSRYVCQYTQNGSTVSMFNGQIAYSDPGADQSAIAVQPGKRYYVSIDALAESTFVGNPLVYAYFALADGTISSPAVAVNMAGVTSGGWATTVGGITAPANATRVWFYVYISGFTAGHFWWTNLNCREMASAELIVDGTITGAKIAAQTISATNIASGTITATQIAAATITGTQIAAGTITGDKINSATSLPASLTIGTTGFSLETVRAQAMNTSVVNLYDVRYQSNGTINYTITGNTVTHTNAGTGWTGNAYSREYYIGAATVSFKTPYSQHAMVGLTDSPTYGATTSEYSYLDYAIYVTAGSVAIYESGTAVASGISGYNDNTQYQVVYDGATVKYYADGTLLRSVATAPNRKFYFGTCIYEQGNAVTNIQFGSTTDNSLANTDPAARINAYTTLIQPGKLLLSGATTFSSWLNGSDNTLIEGGKIAANTIAVNSLKVGARGITISQIDFQVNAAGTALSWSAGYIVWTNDSGVSTATAISAGSTSSVGYVYWSKGASALSFTSSYATANGPDVVCLAVYNGGKQFNANYGGTIIDGTRITTGTITAAQIAANTITAAQIAAGAIGVNQLAANSVTAAAIAAGSVTAAKLNVTSLDAITANLGTMTSTAGDGSITIVSGWGVVQKDSSGHVRAAFGNLTQLGV